MRNRLIEIFEENEQLLGEDIGVGASMYGVMADQIIKELQAGQHETIVIGEEEISNQLFYEIIKEAKETVETLYLCNEIEKINLKRASIQDIIAMIKKECQ